MKRMLKVALALGLVSGFALCAQGVKSAAPSTLQTKVMNQFRGVKLGMKTAEVRAALGAPENSSDASDDFKLTGEDTMTVRYDNGEVKAIQIAFLDPKNAPAWKEVVGDAEVNTMESGAKNARKVMDAEKFWVTMYQNKEGTITRITISKQ